MSLASLLAEHARIRPDAPCITHVDTGSTHTYSEIESVARRLAGVLKERSVGAGDRVAFVVRNHWLFFPLLVACASRRATLLPIDPAIHRDEMAFIIEHADPTLMIVADHEPPPRASRNVVALQTLLSDVAATAQIASASNAESGEDADTLLMIYTSGTTGTGKAVMLTERNLLANARSLVKRYAVGDTDRFYCILPTHHMNAVMITGIAPLVARAQIVLSDVFSFKNAKFYWQALAQHQVTIASLVPSIMAMLLELFPRGSPIECPVLRFAFCGAAPLPAALWQRFEATFHLPVYQGYGLTETTCWSTSIPPEGARRWDSVGVPLDTEIRIDTSVVEERDGVRFAETEETPALGEVLIKGPTVFAGYYKNPQLTTSILTKDGYLRTGDYGYVDANGYLRILGRLKDVIIKNGNNVYASDVDAVLAQHPAVKESKTIGVPDRLVGEHIHSVCVVTPNAHSSEVDLREWATARLSSYMRPDKVTLMGYLPKGPSGKISIRALRKVLNGELRAEIVTSLSTAEYCRAAPTNSTRLAALVQKALLRGTELQLLVYCSAVNECWSPASSERTFARLDAWAGGARRLPEVRPSVTLLLDDTRRESADPIAAIRAEAIARGIAWTCLSELGAASSPIEQGALIAARFPESIWALFDSPQQLDVPRPSLPTFELSVATDEGSHN